MRVPSRGITRRRFLSAAATVAAGAGMLRLPRASGAIGPLKKLVGALDPSKLVTAEQVWAWQNAMVDLGPRFTGSPQHVAYLNFLETQCHLAGVTTFHDQTQFFPRWDADYTQCMLSILNAARGATDLEVMSYFPGSGNTSNMPGGALVAPVVDAGQGLPQDFAAGIATGRFKGAIAFVTEPPLPTTDVLGYPTTTITTRTTR